MFEEINYWILVLSIVALVLLCLKIGISYGKKAKQKEINDRKRRDTEEYQNEEDRQKLAKMEADGYMQLRNDDPASFATHFRNRQDLIERREIGTWLLENTNEFKVEYTGGFFKSTLNGYYIKFDDNTDAMAFKLKWKE